MSATACARSGTGDSFSFTALMLSNVVCLDIQENRVFKVIVEETREPTYGDGKEK